jgi:acetyltransferase-like isoleucine patch superfamily enzyme
MLLRHVLINLNRIISRFWFIARARRQLRLSSGCKVHADNSSEFQCIAGAALSFGVGSHLRMHENSQLIVSGNFSFGRGCTVIVHKGGKLILGRDSWALHDCWIEVGSGQAIMIGDRVTLQLRCSIHGCVEIGDDTLLAPDCYVSSGGHSFDKDKSMTIRDQDRLYQLSRPVVIERNSWLGIRSWIAPGLRLAEGTITGANSVITKDTSKYSVYAGVPAVKIRSYR